MHATGLANFNSSTSQIHNYSTSMTLILSPPYLKTIIKHQTFLSIQRTQKKVLQILNTKHIIIFKQITMLFKTLKIIWVKHERSIVSLKQIHHRVLKDLSEAHSAKLWSSKDISEAHRVKLYSSKGISEAHRVFYQISVHVWICQKVCTDRMIVVN